jgi:hypothetical protein
MLIPYGKISRTCFGPYTFIHLVSRQEDSVLSTCYPSLPNQSALSWMRVSSHQAGPGDRVSAAVSSERVPVLQSDQHHTDLPKFPGSLAVTRLSRGRLLSAVTTHKHTQILSVASLCCTNWEDHCATVTVLQVIHPSVSGDLFVSPHASPREVSDGFWWNLVHKSRTVAYKFVKNISEHVANEWKLKVAVTPTPLMNCGDSGNLRIYSELLDFWTLPIVRYSRN